MTRSVLQCVVLCLALLTGLVGATRADTPSHVLFTSVLNDHVDDGQVDYPAVCADPRFSDYLQQLSSTDPGAIDSVDDQLAFWINVYNAFTLQVVCESYPIDSINDLHFGGLVIGSVLNKTIWDKDFIVISGDDYSLNDVEHEIIRKQFEEPRAHFALVCASKSCPVLRSEAFVGEQLDEQLEDQAQRFFDDPERNQFDLAEKKAYLNKILDWYQKDFAGSDRELLLYVSRYAEPDVMASIVADPDGWDIDHLKYDWSLNE